MRARVAPGVTLAAVCAALAAAACSGSAGTVTSSGTPSLVTTVSPSASASASASGGAQPSSSASPRSSSSPSPSGTAAAISECTASQLEGSLDTLQGAAGSSYEGFEIRNTSSASCSLDGYFGVQLQTSHGPQGLTTSTVSSSGVQPVLVVLPPNTAALNSGNDSGHAIFYMQTSQQCTGATTPTAFLFTPPHLGGSFSVDAHPVNGPSSPPQICGSARVGPISPPGTPPPSF